MGKGGKFFYTIIAGTVSGVWLASFINFDIYLSFFLGALSISIFITARFPAGEELTKRSIILVGLFIVFVALGGARMDSLEVSLDPNLEANLGESVGVEGLIVAEPVGKENYRRLVVEVSSMEDPISTDISSRVLVFAPFYPEASYGDKIYLEGRLSKPETFQTDRGDYFDYKEYLLKDGITYQMFYPKVSILEEGAGNPVLVLLFRAKGHFLDSVERLVPEPHAALVGGILLGTEESLGEELIEKFRDTGIIHIVVLSGYNVAIVAESIRAVFSRFLPFYFSGALGVLAIVAFAIIVGLSATVVRASIMVVIAILAKMSRRPYDVGRALFLAGALMVFVSPRILVYDASFQLSFLATLGLVYISPLLEKYFQWVTKKFGLREIVLATVSTQIAVLPWILYKMGIFSTVSLPVNLLVLPIVSFAMLSGFVTGLLALIWGALAIPFSYITYGFMAYILEVVDRFDALPLSSFQVESFSVFWVLAGYALITAVLYRIWRSKSPKVKISKQAQEFEIIEVIRE